MKESLKICFFSSPVKRRRLPLTYNYNTKNRDVQAKIEKSFLFPSHLRSGYIYAGCTVLRLFPVCQSRLQHDGTLQAFFLQVTGNLMRFVNIALILPVVCITAAAAIKFRPAVFTSWLSIDIRQGKIVLHLLVKGAVKHIAHLPLIRPHELMAGE